MWKYIAGILVSVCFAVASQVAPIPENSRLRFFIGSVAGIIFFGGLWLIAHFVARHQTNAAARVAARDEVTDKAVEWIKQEKKRLKDSRSGLKVDTFEAIVTARADR